MKNIHNQLTLCSLQFYEDDPVSKLSSSNENYQLCPLLRDPFTFTTHFILCKRLFLMIFILYKIHAKNQQS